jgi:3-hydroxybutyryl-CoA dehydratase
MVINRFFDCCPAKQAKGLLAAALALRYIALQQNESSEGPGFSVALRQSKGCGSMTGVGVAGHFLEDLSVGQSATYAKTVTDADIVLFAGISGDVNPVHLDQDYATGTMFKGRIAHGMLTASFISAVLGTKLPGPGCIYVSQNLKFKAPVRIGETVRATVTVTAIDPARARVTVSTVCKVGETVVIDGEAQLVVPRRQAQAAE